MTQYVVTTNQSIDEVGFQFWTTINNGRAAYYSVNGQNWTTSGLITSVNIVWTGWDISDDGLLVYVAADRTSTATIAPITTGSAPANQASMLPVGTAWKKCVYGNGSFVSVNTSTTAAAYMRHKEAIGWTASTLPSAAAWSLLAFGNNTFVTIAPSSTACAVSDDNGVTWSPIVLPAALAWIDLKFANGYFVLVANGSSDVYTSPDGSTWTLRSTALPSASAWTMLSWANLGGVNGTWVCVPSTGTTAAYSTDNGATWSSSTLPASGNWIVAGGKAAWDGFQMFTALTISSTVGAFSYDGINWSSSTITSATYNREFKLIQPRLVTGDGITVNNSATLTVNTDRKIYLAGATALVITNGKVLVQNTSTTEPIRFGTGRMASGNQLTTIDCTNGLGEFESAGNYIEIGTSTGAAGQTFTSPYTFGDYIPVVEIETAAGSGIYEPWVNVTGAPEFNQYNYFRNGLRSVGNEEGGKAFTQDTNQAACQYLMLSNCNVMALTNVITCDSTTGLVPGTWVYGRGTTAIVQEVLSATIFTINVVVAYASSSSTAGFANIPMVAIRPLYVQNTSTLRFGDDVNGKIPPTGAKVRVQNILLTDYSPANYMNNVFASTNAPFHLRTSAGGGKFTFDKTLFGESYSNLTQAASVTMTNCGGQYVPFISECYQVSMNNVAFGLPPVGQVAPSAVALAATGSSTATSATITIPASTAILPGALITSTTIHAATVTTVNSTTSLVISTAAHTTGTGNVTYSYYGPWSYRDNRMLQASVAGFGNTTTNAPWIYVSNANLQNVTMTFGGHAASGTGTSPAIGSTFAGFLGFGYSNDVTVNNFKGMMVGSYPKVRPYNTAFSPNTAGANHTYSNIKLYNVNGVIGCSVVSNTKVTNVTHKQGINNEGYNWASLARVFSDVKNGIPIPKDTQYWFKSRSYKTHNYHDETGYIDSMPLCAVHGNFPKYLQMPQRVGIVPKYAQEVAPALAYGNGSWVFLSGEVASGANTAMVSDDNGATWTAYQLPVAVTTTSVYWRDLIWCPTENYFMAIGGGGAATALFAISKNGKDWSTNNNNPASAQWQNLSFNNSQATNKWVGVAGGTAVSTSALSVSLTAGTFTCVTRTLPSATWISVTSSDAGRFVAIAGGSVASTGSSWSTDGATWSAAVALPASSLWQSIAYGSSRFVAISGSATNGPTAYSTDGTSWTAGTAATLPSGMTYNKILFTGTVFVALAGPAFTATSHSVFAPASVSSCFCTSTDGITWSALKYLPDCTQWIAMANSGNAVGVISTLTGKFAYTADVSLATPTWTLYTDVMPVHNRISIFHQSTEFNQALNTATSVATTLGSSTITCASTAGLQVGTVVSFNGGNMVATGAIWFGAGALGSQANAAIVTSITNATTFVINRPALKTATGLTATFYKGAYALYRSTTSGFTERDETTLVGATQSITAGQMIFGDTYGVVKDTTYYYRLRKLSGGGAASITNCSGTAAASTITTHGSWYYWQSSFEIDGKTGTNVLSSLVFNFFATGIIPGAIVTGPGIPVGTTVTDVPDFDTIILSANLTADVTSRGNNRTYVGFSPAPGMYIFGSNVGLDSKVDTIDSATSMTVTAANTNTFTNQTLRFVVGAELPEIAAIATAPKVIQNNALQSNTLATTWTTSGITATNAAAYTPLDIFIGVNGAAAAGTGSSLYASTANGTLTQTINTGVGVPYTFSIYLRARHPDLRSYITADLTLGTATANLTLTNQWKRYSVTFTTTANTTNAVIKLPLMGSVVEATRAMVTVGSDIPVPTAATTTLITQVLPQQLFNVTDGLAGYFLHDAPAGIVTNIQAAPSAQQYAHLHVDTTSNFVPSDQNQVYSTEFSAAADATFAYASSTNHVVDNYNPVSTLMADRNTLVFPSTGTNGITIKNAVIPFNGSTGNLLNYTTAGYNIYLHNITMVNPRNYIAALYFDSIINNASSGIKLQNVKSTLSGRSAWGAQSLDTIYKGVPGADSLPVNNQTTWNLSTNPTQDSLPVATANLAAVYDNMFHEMTFGPVNKGCLDLRMSASNKAVKPYTFDSGSLYFDNAGGLAFTTNNDVATFEWPHIIKGVTGFSKRRPHIYGIDIGLSPVTSLGALVEYDLDRGAGYSGTWKQVNGAKGIANLSSEAAIDPSTGFRIKFRVSSRYVLKYTSQFAQFIPGEVLRNNVLAAAATATATVVDDETVTTNTTGSLVCNNLTGAWVTGNTIFSTTINTTITNTVANTPASMTSSNISGTTLTVGTLASGTIKVGMLITGTGVVNGTYIVSNIAGTGSGSTWTVNFPQGVVVTTLTGGYTSVVCASTADLFPGMGFRVATTLGGLTAGTTYYVHAVIDATTFTVTSASYGNTAPGLSNASGSVALVGVHGTITAVNTVGVFAPQPSSKLQAVRIFTELDNSPANYYPASVNTLTINGLQSGSDITIIESGTENVLSNTEDYAGTSFGYIYEVAKTVDIVINKPGFYPAAIRNYPLSTTDASVPIIQPPDLSYLD